MKRAKADVVVIGGGPAGMAAALKAAESGADVHLLERDHTLGGVLPQCIHDGFGVLHFGELLTGPQYAQRFIDRLTASTVTVHLDAMVLSLNPVREVVFTNPREGMQALEARAVILAMGCRERTRSQVRVPGSRPAGVYTAGTAQRFINIEGLMVGKRAVILGSGDIGLIMARRLTLEGASVEGVYEILPRPSGLTRNIVQCLNDYGIPLHLSTTISEIKGKKRVTGVVVQKVDEKREPIPGTEREVACDTVILSVGLLPENELSAKAQVTIDPLTGGPLVDSQMQTSVPGIFSCGNVVHVYDLVDHVTASAERAAMGAVAYLAEKAPARRIPLVAGARVHHVVPHTLAWPAFEKEPITFRVREELRKARVVLKDGETVLAQKRERVVKPAEMVVWTLSQKDLAKIPENVSSLTVEVLHDAD